MFEIRKSDEPRSASAEMPTDRLWDDIQHYVGVAATTGAEIAIGAVGARAGGAVGAVGKVARAAHVDEFFKLPNLKEVGVAVGRIVDWRKCPRLAWLNETRLSAPDAPVYNQVVGKVGHFLADKGLDKIADPKVVRQLELLSHEERAQAVHEAEKFATNARAQIARDPNAQTEVQLSWLEPQSGVRVWAKPDVITWKGNPPHQTMVIQDNKSRDYMIAADGEQLDLFATVGIKQYDWSGRVDMVRSLPKSTAKMTLPFNMAKLDEKVATLAQDLRAMDNAWSSGTISAFPARLDQHCRSCIRRLDCADFMALPPRIRSGNGPMRLPKTTS